MTKVVLILYSKYQYDSVAYALKENFEQNHKDIKVVMCDENKYSNFFSSRITNAYYKFSIRNSVWLNRLAFYIRERVVFKMKAKKSSKVRQSRAVANDDNKRSQKFILNYRKVDNIIKRFDPKVVICLTPKSLEKTVRAKQRLEKDFPVYAVTTDYCVNKAFLLEEGIDGYFVQNKFVAQSMQTLGIPENKITVIGTPITKDKMVNEDPVAVVEKFGIVNNLPNVVLVGGRYGSAQLKNAFNILSAYNKNINIIVLSDGSDSILKYIKTFCKANENTENIYCIDKLEKMSDIYSIADVLVCTPTATITYEACARQIPCVLLKDSNSIEKGNASYLLSHGFAFRGENKENLASSVLNLLNDEEHYQKHIIKLPKEFPDESPCDEMVKTIYDIVSLDVKEDAELLEENLDNNEVEPIADAQITLVDSKRRKSKKVKK